MESIRALLESRRVGGAPLVCLEVNPPRGVDIEQVFARLRGNLEGIDLLNITDCALAKMRLSGIVFGGLIKRELGIEVAVNFACRDRNLIAIQSDLLAGWVMGVRGVVALTGDAITIGDHPDAKGVFEVNSVGLLRLISKLNAGHDQSGNKLSGAPDFVSGVVVNPNAKNAAVEVKRLQKKLEAGGSYALSQPVFDFGVARAFLEQAEGLGMPILIGLMGAKTPRMAKGFTKIPGIKLAGEIEALLGLPDDEDITDRFLNHSIELARALLREDFKCLAGFHVISGATPTLALRLARELVGAVKSD